MRLTLRGRQCSDNITASTATHKDGYHTIAKAENVVVEERVKKMKKKTNKQRWIKCGEISARLR